jgi:F-type H+-transporting ATPase subunit b
MEQLLTQLGIDWHLLISQAVNFFLLLIVLRIFVYKPLLTVLRERREKIENGIIKAEEADRR